MFSEPQLEIKQIKEICDFKRDFVLKNNLKKLAPFSKTFFM